MPVSKEELLRAVQGGSAGASLVEAMQARLDSLVGRPSGLIETLPVAVQRRIKFLQSLQENYDEKEEEYQKELDELDRKYAALYAPIFAKRAEVVKGAADAPEDIQVDGSPQDSDQKDPGGIPNFWLAVFQASEVTASQITEKDETVLEFLVDVRSEELYGEEECGFKLTFEFADNPFFTNKLLTKTYHLVESDEPVLERAVGTVIDWKPGKNVTIKTLKKKPKPGRGGAKAPTKLITKTEVVSSFFSFFSPPTIPDEADELDEEKLESLQSTLEEDYEIGETIRDQLIPNAVRYYTGEVQEESEAEDDDEEEDDDDEGDEDDSDSPSDSDSEGNRNPSDQGKQSAKVQR